jgi:lipopolysaccharide transport system permease protein
MEETLSQPKPYLTIRPSSGWAALNLAELWQYRDLLHSLASRDVKLRYRQTALGVIWVILQPLLAAGIFSFVFGKVAKLPSDGVPYFLFSYAGLLGWNLCANTLNKVSGSLTGNAHLISKVFFPRLILPLSTLHSSLIDFGVATAMLAILMVMNRVAVGPGLLLLPLWMALLLMIAVGVGLFCASLMVSYRDVQFVLPVAVQFALYASPVAYAVSAVPPQFRTLYFLNPLSGLLEAFRWSLLGTGHLQWGYVAYSGALAVLLLVGGAFAFKRMERKFADVI